MRYKSSSLIGISINVATLLFGSSYAYLLPRDFQNKAVDGESYPDGFTEDNFDVELMLYSVGSMLIMYLFICIIYLGVRYVITSVVVRNSTVSLSTDEEYQTSRSRNLIEMMNARWPSALDDQDEVKDKVLRLPAEEQFYYKQGEEYIRQNPPLLISPLPISEEDEFVDPIINEQTNQFIEEEGAYAWEFQPDQNLPNDTIMVENKTEITFLNYNYDASVQTNLPIPCINRVYYCEFKIFELNTSNVSRSISDNETVLTQSSSESDADEEEEEEEEVARDNQHHSLSSKSETNDLISFGLSTSPYPYFRLPGRHHHSIAYDSNGSRRFNDSFELDPELKNLFPSCEKGDVIGIGYRSRSGTVFFTRNGKKLNEKSVGGHIRGWKFKYLYPTVGANVPCKIHVNFGTYGFLYIEANVKKWGYSKMNGMKLPPPSYDQYGQDALLESAGEDNDDSNNDDRSVFFAKFNEDSLRDENGQLLPPPPGFEFSTSPHAYSINEEINMDSLPMDPPNYSDNESSYKSPFAKIPMIGSSKKLQGLLNFDRESIKTAIEGSEGQDKDDYDDYDDDDLDDDYEIRAESEVYSDDEFDDLTTELQHMIQQDAASHASSSNNSTLQ
ncbi:hypothetical protein KAFR_0B04810 [Kazachstania africana CBS 2517]|uniref:SPRY domain-containing protein n=1 Tax=Kazachstania africana (strain ATCC 22294 / BCRC 22015 / CBS 2517 / CECT 1963 / NBRC 1671 / NRRL Y-8276) TaxID=1071382 RepID=H2AQX7_KAZAF|nr:hypothetical protein KAFR_0B04810 [Kazachstania africana CBS 2517]CCF56777.1 hypothetical protein KAFR_0B04810 [Kazachstania africana CBS 2517]